MHEMEEFFPGRTPLENLELHANRKAHWNPRYADAIRRIQSHRITVNGCFILGLDGQDATVFPNILDFSITHGLYDVQITLLAPFPGTPLYDRLVRQSRILAPGRWDLCTLFDVNFLPSPLTLDELKNGLYWLGKNLYSAATTRLGRQGFHDQWRRAAVPAAAS